MQTTHNRLPAAAFSICLLAAACAPWLVCASAAEINPAISAPADSGAVSQDKRTVVAIPGTALNANTSEQKRQLVSPVEPGKWPPGPGKVAETPLVAAPPVAKAPVPPAQKPAKPATPKHHKWSDFNLGAAVRQYSIESYLGPMPVRDSHYLQTKAK